MSLNDDSLEIKNCPYFRSNIIYQDKKYNNVCLIGLLMYKYIIENKDIHIECYKNVDCLYRELLVTQAVSKKYFIDYLQENSKVKSLENQIKQLKEENQND